MSAPFKLSFEEPHHGSMTIRFELGDQVEDFSASDVPNNPIEDLCNALFSIARGDAAVVWWDLEPDGYYLYFEPLGERLVMRLTFAPNSNRHREIDVFSIEAPPREILLVLWRFLRKFESRGYGKPHWSQTDLRGLEELGRRLKRM